MDSHLIIIPFCVDYFIKEVRMVYYNKMLSMHNKKEQIFIKLPRRQSGINISQYCMNGEIEREVMNCCRKKR